MSDTVFVMFRGDVLKGERKLQVVSRFSALFQASEDRVMPFFTGKSVFFRKGLDLPTARKYYAKLHKIGARAFLGLDSAVSSETLDTGMLHKIPVATCTLCNTYQIFDDHCVNCNGRPLKEIRGHTAKNNKGQAQKSGKGAEREELKGTRSKGSSNELKKAEERARKAFTIGGILMLAAFIIDEILFRYGMFEAVAIWKKTPLTLGILPYVIATIVMTYGCWYYVKTKGYPPVLSLLGLTNIFGLGILILLPNRVQPGPKRPIFSRVNISAVTMIILSLYWAQGTSRQHQNAEEFLNRPIPLSMELSAFEAYENDTYLIWSDVLVDHEEKVADYIVDAYDLLSTYDFPISTIEQIADRIYFAISNLSIWLYQQRFLHVLHTSEVPASLSEAAIKRKVREYIESLIQKNQTLDNRIVDRTHMDWTMGYHREGDPSRLTLEEFITDVYQRIYVDLIFPRDLKMMSADLPARIAAMLQAYDPVKDPFFADLRVEERQILIRLKDDLPDCLAGKKIRFGIWEEPGREKWSRERGTYRDRVIVIRRIGGDLPDKYLQHHPAGVMIMANLQIMEEG